MTEPPLVPASFIFLLLKVRSSHDVEPSFRKAGDSDSTSGASSWSDASLPSPTAQSIPSVLNWPHFPPILGVPLITARLMGRIVTVFAPLRPPLPAITAGRTVPPSRRRHKTTNPYKAFITQWYSAPIPASVTATQRPGFRSAVPPSAAAPHIAVAAPADRPPADAEPPAAPVLDTSGAARRDEDVSGALVAVAAQRAPAAPPWPCDWPLRWPPGAIQ